MILPQRKCQSDGKWMGGMEFEESFLEESCHTTAAQPTHHWGKCPFRPSQFTGLTAWLPQAGVRDPACLNVAGEKEQVGSSVRKGSFQRKVYHQGFEAKRHHNYPSMWTTCPRELFLWKCPQKEVESSEQGKPEKSLHALGCGESENSQPEMGWFPHIRETTGIRHPHDSVHHLCVCGGGGWVA